MKTVDYNLDHLFGMHINFDKYPLCRGNIVFLDTILSNGISRTILSDDSVPLAVVSVMLIHPGVATVSIIPSVDAHDKNKHEFISGVLSLRDELENIVRVNKIRRLETLTMDDPKHNRWMQYMGFLPEGTKEQYGANGEDFIMWRRLWV